MTRLRLIFNLGKVKREVNVTCPLWETVMKLFFQKLFNCQNNAESIVTTWMGEKLVEYHALKKIERV